MSPRPPKYVARRRVVTALQLAPMTKKQLEDRLMLHRATVSRVLHALIRNRQVLRSVRCSEKCGTWPDLFSLATTSTGDYP